MDAISRIAALDSSSMVPSELSALLWVPLLLICAGLFAWLWVLIALQKIERQPEPSKRASASQLETTKTIANAAMPEGIA